MAGSVDRPDSSGLRGGKPGLRSRPGVGHSEFPYDRDKAEPYGFHGQITPKDTDHSVWDEVAEALGVPFNVKMASRGNNGAGVPGANKGWAGMPPRAWDENDIELEAPLSIDQRVPPAGEAPPFYEPTEPEQMRAHPGVEVEPVDLSMTIFTVARELLAPGSVWSELLNISSRKGR